MQLCNEKKWEAIIGKLYISNCLVGLMLEVYSAVRLGDDPKWKIKTFGCCYRILLPLALVQAGFYNVLISWSTTVYGSFSIEVKVTGFTSTYKSFPLFDICHI